MNKEFGGKRRYFLAGAVGLTLGLGFATWRTRTTPATDTAVRDLWLANLEGLDGQPAAMQRYQGRPLLVNFWATWCPPCVEELPMIDAFYQENKDKVAVLGIAVDRLDAVKSFLGNWPVSFDIALAGMAGVALTKSLGNPSGGLPFTVLISSTGAILERKVGKLSESDLNQYGLMV